MSRWRTLAPKGNALTDPITSEQLSRRSLAGLATAAGIGIPLLAACGDDGGDNGGTGSDGSTPTSGGTLAPTSDIEVGGGAVFKDQNVVVTQPAEGDFRGFSATCTHQGCQVVDVLDGTINCRCHNSKFSIEDGSVQEGPARKPLPEVQITVEGDQITVA